MKAAIYARVSTADQHNAIQVRELTEYVQRRGWELAGVYQDTMTGAKASRPGLDKLMADARQRRFDVVLVWKLDRFGRSLVHCVSGIQELASFGARFIATSQGLDTDESSPASKLLLHILAAVAQFERELIRERVSAGMRNAKSKGTRTGNPIGRPRRVFSAAFFVVRTKSNVLLQRRYSHSVDKSTGVRSDHTVILTAIDSAKAYPDALRRVSYLDVETRKRFKLLTNNFALPALTIAQTYKARWQVELFFKWIKQHLRIQSFYGTSENAVKTQIWIAVSIYVLVAIVRKRLGLQSSLYQILQILSVMLFEKTPILQALQPSDYQDDLLTSTDQLILFDL